MMIEEEILSSLLSKLISDGVDISKTAIRNFVEGRYKSYQSLYSQIYTILIGVLDKITYHCYDNNRDRIYEAAEILLREYRNSPQKGESPDYIRACLSSLHSRTDDANCCRLQTLLYEEFSKNEYQEVYRAIRLFQQEQKNRMDQAAFSELGKKVEEVKQLVAEKSDGRGKDSEYGADKPGQVNRGEREGESGEVGAESREVFINNRKQDYIAQWNQCMFLHRAKREKQLTLADAFVMPDCEGQAIAQNTGITSKDLFNEIIWKFADLPSASTMLITGVPGIGKSSVVSWIAHTYEENDRFILLRFRDWESEELEQGLLKAICRTLACKKEDLRGRILVLDGFDELKALNLREHILNRFLGEQLDIIGLKIIITSRPNYINMALFENVFTLLPFNTDKIKKFHFLVTGSCPGLGEYFENQDIFGIPVILDECERRCFS